MGSGCMYGEPSFWVTLSVRPWAGQHLDDMDPNGSLLRDESNRTSLSFCLASREEPNRSAYQQTAGSSRVFWSQVRVQ